MSWLYLSNPCASSTTPIAHGAAGAAGARLSLRPLLGREQTKLQNPDENVSRERFWLFENWNSKFDVVPASQRGARLRAR